MTTAATAERGAATGLAGTFAVQTMASMSMFGVAVIAPAAAPDIGVAATSIGTFTAIAYAFAMPAGLLTGAFTDRYGAIRVCQATMLLTFAGVAVLALSTPLAAVAGAVLLGLGYGPVNPASTHILARVAPPARRPLFFSIKQTGMPVGTAIAGALLPALVLAFDWRVAILAAGALACLVGMLVQPLRARLDAIRDPSRAIRAGSVVDPLKLVWREPRLRCLAVVGFSYAGCQVALATFYVVYLTAALAMPLTTAGLVYTVLQIAAIMGRLFWGAIADRIFPASRVLVGLGVATAAVTVVAGLFAPGWPVWSIAVVSFLLGATSHGWNGLFFSELVERAPPDRTGEAAGGIQFVSLAGVAAVPPLFGLVVVATGGYLAAFLAVACAMVAAAIHLAARLR